MKQFEVHPNVEGPELEDDEDEDEVGGGEGEVVVVENVRVSQMGDNLKAELEMALANNNNSIDRCR